MNALDRQELMILREMRKIHTNVLQWKERQETQRIREEIGDRIPIEEYIKPMHIGDYFRDMKDRLSNMELLLENIALKRQLKGEADAEADVSEQV